MAGLPRPLRKVAAARRHLGSAPGARADPHARTKRGAIGEAEWSASVDTTVGRAHRPSETQKKGALTPLNEALGRGRGGSSTKPHLSCDGRGLPLSLALTAGQRNESTQLVALLEDLPGEGRGIAHTLPERDDQPERREQRGDKPPAFEAGLYRKRDAVEGRGQQAQAVAVATRYEKRAANYRAVVVAASPVLWMAS
jgi:transposase